MDSGPTTGSFLVRVSDGIGKFGPWVWFGGCCLVASLSDLSVNTLGPYIGGCCIILLMLPVLPVVLGCVGAYYRQWWVSIGGPPAMVVSTHLAEFVSKPLLGSAPPSSLVPGPVQGRVMLAVGGVMLVIAVVTHLIAQGRFPKRFPAGCCQSCGYDLTGNVSGRCPECGRATHGVV